MPNPEAARIALIPGDGIGPEVIDEGVRVLEAAARSMASGGALEVPHA